MIIDDNSIAPASKMPVKTARGGTGTTPPLIRHINVTCTIRSHLPPLIGCSRSAADIHWLREMSIRLNSIAVVLEIWRQTCPMWSGWIVWESSNTYLTEICYKAKASTLLCLLMLRSLCSFVKVCAGFVCVIDPLGLIWDSCYYNKNVTNPTTGID